MSIAEASSALSTAEREAILGFCGHYPVARAACIEALKLVQQNHNHVSDQHIKEIAALVGLSPAELDGVATFYNLIFRRPVGRHVILLCDSVSCWIMGRDRINRHICKKLGITPGQTSADGAYTLLPIVCLGHCDHAPAMLIDETLHSDVDQAMIDTLLDSAERGR